MRTWIALLALMLPVGCKKDSKDNGGDKADPVGKDPNGVRPPAKADLAEYVKDIPGNGPLKATFETSMGTIHCELLEDNAPLTVTNFVGLATGKKPWKDPKSREVVRNRPLYDNTIFHRVIPGFMIQGGDPMGVGMGGPGYRFPNEDGGAKFSPGTLAMANSGKDTNGSQFFITEVTTGLPPEGYTIFGKCTEVDLVKQIAAVPKECPECDPGRDPKGSTPRDPVTLKHVTISR